jgi:hypothetical protein
MGAADAGMKKASASAAKNLDKINELLDDQVDVIKDLKKAFGDASDEMEDFGDESEKATKKAGRGFSELSGGVKKAMKSIQNRVMQFNVANIAQNMKTLTGESGNLTNSLEATMTSMMQTTKPIAAELNLSSNEMKKFAGRAAGMAYGMNTSADAVAHTMASIHVANKGAKDAMDALGMSTKDWVKVVQTTNVPMNYYTAILGDMTTSWGASPKEAAKMLDNLMAIGKVAGTGAGAIKNAKVQLDELGEVFKDLPPSMARSSKEIMSLMESSARMSGVFRQMGDTQEEAISKANTVARMFAEQAVHVEKALAIGDERALADNPLIKFLTQLGIGFDEARDIVLTGSKDTVMGMQRINDLYARFGDNASPQVQRALSGLSGALGEGSAGLSYLAQNTTKGTAALSEMARVSVKGAGALKQFGKDAYSSGLTLQDTYDRATLAFDNTIRSIARTQVKGLVKKQTSGMREAGKELRTLGSDKTWGPWVNMLSQFKQMGMGGLFSSLAQSTGVGAKGASKFGAKFGLITSTMKQLGDELGPVMQLVGMFGPLGVLGAGAVGISSLFAMDSGDRKKMLSPFSELFGKLKVGFGKVLGYLKVGFKNLVDSGVVSDIVDGLSKAFGYVVDIFPWQRFLEGVTFVVGKLAKSLSKLDWSPIIKGIVGSIKDVVGSILDGFGEAFGTGGQIGAAFVGLAALGGGSFMSVLSNPTTGIGAIALAAGVLLGKEVASHLSGGGVSGRGLGMAEGMLKWSKEDIRRGWAMDPNKMAKSVADIEKALKWETEEAWFPDIEAIKKMSSVLKTMKDIQSQVATENQTSNVREFSGGNLVEGLFGSSTMMTPEEAEGVLLGGQTTGDQFIEGISSSLEKGKDLVSDKLAEATSSATAHSPIEYGPLAGTGDANAAYRGGYFVMEQFANGITDSTDMIRIATENALDESVILSLDTYATKMRELASQRTFLADVAKSMVKDLTDVQIESDDTEANVNVKKSFKTAMSLPGLASVVLAITNEGASTRKMLKSILEENVRTTAAVLGKKTPVGSLTSEGIPAV